MYNVLEKLRANQPLSKKEETIHELGLVSVLRQLHDELDAAVFAAYGWPAPLSDAEILERLVALNAERAREETFGLVRWLRPEYQNPGGTSQEQQPALLATEPVEVKQVTPKGSNGKLAWPKTLPDRVKAVSQVLSASSEPVTAESIATQFSRARRPAVEEILETLCTMGQAQRGKVEGTYLPG